MELPLHFQQEAYHRVERISSATFGIVCIARERGGLRGLLNLNISENEVVAILGEAGFVGYRLDGATAWIMKTIEMLGSL